MRYSEAIRKLEEEPTLEFRLVDTYKTWTLKTDYDPRFPDDEALYFILECEGEDSMGDAGKFSGNLLTNDDRWELVRHPVAWQEAIEAWANGKTIRLAMPMWEQVWKPSNAVELNQSRIKDGTWYVEEKDA